MTITIKSTINSSKILRNNASENKSNNATNTAIKQPRINNPIIRYVRAYSLGLRVEKYCFFIFY